MHRPPFCALALAGSLLLGSVATEARKPVEPAPALVRLDPSLQTEVEVTRRVWAKEHSRGLGALLPSLGALVIPPGSYPVEFSVRSGDREWLLVPYWLRADGQERSPDTSSSMLSGCTSRFRRFLALDRQTNQFETRVWRIQQHSCANDLVAPSTEGEWSRAIRFQEAGAATVRSYRTAEEATAAAAAEQHRRQEDAERALATQRAVDARDAPRKRQIGARLCRRDGDWQIVGFTERVSPDNGKVQIRVVQQHRLGAPHLRAAEFQEQILWDAPERWSLCE